ncbi:MAG: hypothetical protein IPK04_06590 [Bdellovibrionales bacterium]|nr:hypothetical protein [Bdellovibrionales bacterium]
MGRHSLKSPQNARPGTSSYQFEIYGSNHKPIDKTRDELIENSIATAEKLKLFSRREIIMLDVRFAKYANITFDLNIVNNRKCVVDFMNSKGIHTVGRYGEWDYFWSDQSFLSGKRAADKLAKQML